jgi:predicted GNAT superfamily acetyltransferase
MSDIVPAPILPAHYAAILRNNAQFVHWLSPLDAAELAELLGHATHTKQLYGGEAALIAYDGNGPYRHTNVDWLSARLENYFYVDRVIIGEAAQGQGAGRTLYTDLEQVARQRGHSHIACEVNTKPNNPGSHAFHIALGYEPLEDVDYPNGKSLRYYVRKLT